MSKNVLFVVIIFVVGLMGCAQQTVSLESDLGEVVDVTSDENADKQEFIKINDTNQNTCTDAKDVTDCPDLGERFYGQDAQYAGYQMDFTDSGDGIVIDNNTGLMWTKGYYGKYQYYDAPGSIDLAGFDDWRIPNIKELYSLIDFSGQDISSISEMTDNMNPFIDDEIFEFAYGDSSQGDRIIDSQWITTNIYAGKVMDGSECFFGVNFADGRIKCYPTQGRNNGYYLRYVRGEEYGINRFADKADMTIVDEKTGLMWQKSDSKEGLDWEGALDYCENLELADHSDWRLPNAKELQYLVDYSRGPDVTDSAAIDGMFDATEIANEAGQKDFGFYWTSTTHLSQRGAEAGAYISFGRGMGNMPQFGGWIDVHGAGSQRSDPKSGDPGQFSNGRGPQGDAIRIYNMVRCVR